MARRVKEENRIETIIRGLLKEPDNRRCINCNSLGPQYVCTTFWTFICTNCSGVHREFTHRVKSVSMAKFSDDEIMALQAGGNERAKRIYFKTWDPQLCPYPDSNNLQKLREFISLIYVDRKYAGDNGFNKLPRVKSDSRGVFGDRPRWDRRDDYMGRSAVKRGSNSGRDDPYECNLFERCSSSGSIGLTLRDFLEERNPRDIKVMPKSRSYRNRSTRVEIVDDRYREDGSVKRYERNSLRGSGSMVKSPGSLRNTTSLPIIRPFDKILGDQLPESRVSAPSGADDQKASEDSSRGQKADEEAILRSTSLIDFLDYKFEAEKMDSETNNESSSIADSKTQPSAAVLPINSVESLLFGLSSPVTTSAACTSSMLPSAMATAELSCTDSTDVETTKVPGMSNSSETLAVTVIASDPSLDRDNTYPMTQDIQTYQPPSSTSFNTLQSSSSVESLMNEQRNISSATDDLGQKKIVPVVQSLQDAIPSSSARNEIPEDLFTSSYPSSFIPAVDGWQMNPPHGAGYNFHPPAMTLGAYPIPSKPKNPFDLDDDRWQVQAATFPPMPQDLPNMPASATSQFQASPYESALPSQAYGMNMHLVPRACTAQLSNDMLFSRPEGNANIDTSEDAFASLNPFRRESKAQSLPAAPTSSLSRAGNPFG